MGRSLRVLRFLTLAALFFLMPIIFAMATLMSFSPFVSVAMMLVMALAFALAMLGMPLACTISMVVARLAWPWRGMLALW